MSSLLRRGLGSFVCTLVVSAAVSSGCSATPKGSLMLSISTDMQTPKDISTVSIFVTEGSTVKFDYVGRVLPDGTVSLPSTLALVEPETPNAQVEIRVIGFNGQTAQVLRDVQTTIPHERTALLRMPLDFLDLGSVTGQLPAQFYPTNTDGVAEGDSQFDPTDPTVIVSTCDPLHLCQTPGANCQTMINGQCTSAAVVSSTLPAYAPAAVYGDGGIMANGAPESCFQVETCFAGATPVTAVSGQGTQTCSFPLPSGQTPSTLNVALVTPSTGACLASGCYVPLPNDPDEGWTLQGGTVQLAPGICAKLGSTTTLAVASGSCPTETLSEPVCEPTTLAEVAEAGAPPILDAGPADAMTPEAGSACGGNFVVTCPATSTCGGGYAALTVSGTQAMLYIEKSNGDGGETVPYAGVVDPTSCIATFVLPGPEAGSCGGPMGTVTANLATGANFAVGCSNGSGDGTCTVGTLSCTAARGTLDAGPSNGNPCSTGETNCSGTCADTSTDPDNCGTCGNTCGPTESCAQGACASLVDAGEPPPDDATTPDATTTACAPPGALCNAICVNEQTDPNNCGACGFVCSGAATCTLGTCSQLVDAGEPPLDATTTPDATTTCAPPGILCNSICVNEQTDPNNCGACGFVCLSTQSCVGGTCTASTTLDAGSSSGGTSDASSPDSGVVRYADCEQFLGSGSTTSAAVMTGLYYPGGLVPDQGTLYMTSLGAIVTGSTTGGTSESYYAADGGTVLGVTVDQTYAYWTRQDGTIWSCEKSGCTSPTMIATSDLESGGGAIRTDGVNVCWAYATGVTCMTAGANPQPVLSIQGEPNPVGLSMCGGYVIWSNMVADGTVRIAEVSTTGTADTLAYGLATPDGVASDGTYVYVATMGVVGGTQQALLKLPMDVLDASAPQAIYQGPGQQWSSFVAVRGPWVYWTNQYDGVVYATPTDGGTTVTVTESPYPLLISTDTTTVYWAESDDPASVFTAPLQ